MSLYSKPVLLHVPVFTSYAAVHIGDESPFDASPRWFELPAVSSFGPWGNTARCHQHCEWVTINNATGAVENVCNPSGRWPEGMCSLKRLAHPAKPEYWSSDEGGRPLVLAAAAH
jgi:hypothetical protein